MRYTMVGRLLVKRGRVVAMRTARTLVAIVAVMLLGSVLWAQEEVPPPAEQTPAGEAQPATDGVTVVTITSYLEEMGYVYKVDKSGKVPEIELLMRGNNSNYDLRIFIDDPRKIVYTAVNRIMTVPNVHPRKYALLQRLMELNWELLIGKYEWDKSDGEVRLSYTFSTENGLGYDAFAACFQLLVLTADRDYPKLMKLMWTEEIEEPAASAPAAENEPTKTGNTKETEPKEAAPAGE